MAGPVATVWAQFKLDMSDFSSKLTSAAKGLKKFAREQQKLVRDTNPGYASATAMIRTFNRSLSDTANITRGIVISQAFYAAVGAIRDASNALWDFNKELDYAHVTYSALFGNANLARDFMSVLQEHAIETIFGYQDLAGISKKLLAYGLEYENLMFIMEGLTNLGTMSGDSAALDRIALALGQIYTKGKLSAEEMRQLANAYVPITDIIQQKFGLTGDDLKRVGDLNLPAEDVINAIVDYANQNFGGVGDAAMYTITGLEAKIVDTLKVVGAEMIQPLTTAYKSFLAYVSKGLESIREAFNAGGIGGVFEYLVPDENTQTTIRTFLANIKNLFNALLSLGRAAGQVFGNFAQVFVAVFNAVVPTLTAITNGLAAVISSMATASASAAALRIALVAAAAGFLIMRAQAIGALVITAVTNAVNALSKALVVLATIISKHPILSLLAMLGVALVGVSVSSSNANSSLSGLFDTLAGTGGSSSKDILQKTEKDLENTNNAIDQFNNRLEEGKENADEFADSIGGAGSAAKKTAGLLSFDEVYKLNPKDESGGGGGGGVTGALEDLGDLIDGFSGIGGALIPEIPDFSDYVSDFGDSLLGGLTDGLKDKIAAGGWGSLIGGVIGALIGAAFGNPILGAKIGMGAGAVAGVIFNELEYAISNVGTGVVTGVLKAIGNALAKAGAGTFGSIIKNAFVQGGLKGVWNAVGGVLKTTGLKAILKGGAVGMVVGLVVDGIAHLLWSWLDEKIGVANKDTAKIGQTIGSILGTVIGAIIGGPAGMLIGSAVGTFVGGFVGLFWEPIKQFFVDLGTAIGVWFAGIVADIHSWLDQTGILQWAADTYSGLSTWWADTTTSFANWCVETYEGIKAWANDTWTSLSTWWNDSITGFSEWWTNTFGSLSNWFNDTIALFSDWDSINGDTLEIWWEETKTGFSEWKKNTIEDITAWVTETISGYAEWEKETKKSIFGWVTDTAKSIWSWAGDTISSYAEWEANVKKTIFGWVADTAKSIGGWVVDTFNAIRTWQRNTNQAILDWITGTAKNIWNWAVETDKAIDDWVDGVLKVLGGFAIAAKRAVDDLLSGTWTNMLTWFNETKTNIKTKWESLFDPTKWKSGWESVKGWFSSLLSGITNWFSGLGSLINTLWDGLFDGKSVSVNTSSSGASLRSASLAGHATGGIFNREHIARFAEGNKAEMIVPLENASAMQPFVDAISSGIVSSLAPVVAMGGSSNNSLPPLYVGTLVADDRGLRELYKKFEVIQVQENARRGTVKEAF